MKAWKIVGSSIIFLIKLFLFCLTFSFRQLKIFSLRRIYASAYFALFQVLNTTEIPPSWNFLAAQFWVPSLHKTFFSFIPFRINLTLAHSVHFRSHPCYGNSAVLEFPSVSLSLSFAPKVLKHFFRSVSRSPWRITLSLHPTEIPQKKAAFKDGY